MNYIFRISVHNVCHYCNYVKITFYFRASFPVYLEPLEDSPVQLSSNGAVFWYLAGFFNTYCQVDMFYFPFDTQTCYINMSSTQTGIILQETLVKSAIDHYYENTMWILMDHKLIHTGYSAYPLLTWSFTLKRQSSYFLMTTIMPLILLSVVGLMVFPLPPDSGEKVTLSVTCLMSFFLTQLSISEHMPTSWTSMPIISKCTCVI